MKDSDLPGISINVRRFKGRSTRDSGVSYTPYVLLCTPLNVNPPSKNISSLSTSPEHEVPDHVMRLVVFDKALVAIASTSDSVRTVQPSKIKFINNRRNPELFHDFHF